MACASLPKRRASIAKHEGEYVNRRYEVAAYYFPGYHPDPRCDRWHGTGWTEWELVKRAEARFPGHDQPKTPLWGYEDESEPEAMARKIDAAADHGLTAFLFDWYWYDNSPFLNGALDRGYLGAHNNDRLKFALMWANHDWVDIHPAVRNGPPRVLVPGAQPRAHFEAATDHIVERYLRHPSYWRLDGRAYFSFYELIKNGRRIFGGRVPSRTLARSASEGPPTRYPRLHCRASVSRSVPRTAASRIIRAKTVVCFVSSRTGAGLAELKGELRWRLMALRSARGEVMASTAARCQESLRIAGRVPRSGARNIAQAGREELAAAEIRVALETFRIASPARSTPMTCLAQVFSRFCIGK